MVSVAPLNSCKPLKSDEKLLFCAFATEQKISILSPAISGVQWSVMTLVAYLA